MTAERMDFYFALYVFCSDYHSGQWSRGYRIMSRFNNSYWKIRVNSEIENEARESETYANLVSNYADKM